MDKRGQFTLFVILGIVLILIVGVVYYYRADLFSALGIAEEIAYPSEVQEVVDATQECVEDVAKDAVTDVSLSAGYYNPGPEFAYAFGDTFIPYGYYAGSNILLLPEQMEAGIEAYVLNHVVEQCYFLHPNVVDFNLTLVGVGVDAVLQNESVDFTVELPMTAQLGANSYDLPKEYEFQVFAKFGYVYVAAFNIVQQSVADPNYFDYTAMLAQGVNVDVLRMDDTTYVFILSDPTSYDGEEEYRFMFAGYYPIAEEVEVDEELASVFGEEFFG